SINLRLPVHCPHLIGTLPHERFVMLGCKMFARFRLLGLLATTAVLVFVATSQATELLGLYKFEGNFLDSSGNGNHGTPDPNGGPGFTTGFLGQGAHFTA